MNAVQIKEIAELVKLQSAGKIYIPAKTISKFAKTYCLKHEIIVKEKGRYYAGNSDIVYSLDAAILWELVKPMLENGIGFSVTKKADWLKLNIYPRGHRFHQPRDLSTMEQIFIRLHFAGYINFNAAGSVWVIYINK